MNYNTQNVNIASITEKTLIVCIDVGSETHFARAFDWRNYEYSRKPFKFAIRKTTALSYALNHQAHFQMFLEDGRLEISNNLCESHIRPFATSRRAWLFADTPDGARANAVLYTLVESAKANDLNVYNYLDYLLTELPELGYEHKKHPEQLDKYLPWSEELPAGIRMNRKNRKCV